ncbi:hypothetical protein LXL04_000098 [Taraxacum kok-saghyz]
MPPVMSQFEDPDVVVALLLPYLFHQLSLLSISAPSIGFFSTRPVTEMIEGWWHNVRSTSQLQQMTQVFSVWFAAAGDSEDTIRGGDPYLAFLGFARDFKEVDEKLLAPTLKALSHIQDISVESQVLYHSPKSSSIAVIFQFLTKNNNDNVMNSACGNGKKEDCLMGYQFGKWAKSTNLATERPWINVKWMRDKEGKKKDIIEGKEGYGVEVVDSRTNGALEEIKKLDRRRIWTIEAEERMRDFQRKHGSCFTHVDYVYLSKILREERKMKRRPRTWVVLNGY